MKLSKYLPPIIAVTVVSLFVYVVFVIYGAINNAFDEFVGNTNSQVSISLPQNLVGVWGSEWGTNTEITSDGRIHFLDDRGRRIVSHNFTLRGTRLSIPALDTLDKCTGSFTFENGVLFHHAEGMSDRLTRRRR